MYCCLRANLPAMGPHPPAGPFQRVLQTTMYPAVSMG